MREAMSAVRLAGADFVFEWRLSSCLVLALAAVLAPLLVLFGLKYGIVEAIRAPMVENPAYREVKPIGAGTFTRSWFEQLSADPAIEFIVPRTRTISATLRLRSPDRQVRANVTAELIPTAPGDPVTANRWLLSGDAREVLVSSSVARKLKLERGDSVIGMATRTRDGRQNALTSRFG